MRNDLAGSLRAARDRLDPRVLGLPERGDTGARRAPGLRRAEVATEAGISVNYLMRLEQGRATHPSPSVVTALVRALRLDAGEAAHLHRLAGHTAETERAAARVVTPSIQRMIDRFGDVPIIVIDPSWTIQMVSPLARALLVDGSVGENAARRQFLGPHWVRRNPEDEARFERDIVRDLHLHLGRHPDDPDLHALVTDLHAGSARFRELWADPQARAMAASRKTFHHPEAGSITVDCDILDVPGSDLRVVVWTVAAGTPGADAFAALQDEVRSKATA